MKILNDLRVNPNQTDPLQKQKTAAENFGDMLAQEIKQTQGVTTESGETTRVSGSTSNMAILDGSPAQKAEGISTAMQETALQLETLFSDLENYAALLRSDETGSLKTAYNALQNMNDSIAHIKETAPDLANSPQLASLVNELDVLTTTEIFKFNRGDYL